MNCEDRVESRADKRKMTVTMPIDAHSYFQIMCANLGTKKFAKENNNSCIWAKIRVRIACVRADKHQAKLWDVICLCFYHIVSRTVFFPLFRSVNDSEHFRVISPILYAMSWSIFASHPQTVLTGRWLAKTQSVHNMHTGRSYMIHEAYEEGFPTEADTT